MKKLFYLLIISLFINVSCSPKWKEKTSGNLSTVNNEGGAMLILKETNTILHLD